MRFPRRKHSCTLHNFMNGRRSFLIDPIPRPHAPRRPRKFIFNFVSQERKFLFLNFAVNDMLRNAKLYSSNIRYCNGLSFGEFSILAADFRKFRWVEVKHDKFLTENSKILNFPLNIVTKVMKINKNSLISSRTNQNGHTPFQITSLSPKSSLRIKKQVVLDQLTSTDGKANEESVVEAPEVFLGGSCNPTTWRADVAMPELKKLGISFYNPVSGNSSFSLKFKLISLQLQQVSQWTPDLIALEHRAKEKARVLFFVMDSETRASAGAIEAAHIAGQNQKPLILVLHPYKRNQKILNEPISEEWVLTPRHLIKTNVRFSRQRIPRPLSESEAVKAAGDTSRPSRPGQHTYRSAEDQRRHRWWGPVRPSAVCQLQINVSSSLPSFDSWLTFCFNSSVRRSYDRVINNEAGLTITQCRQVLSQLGYRKDLITIDNLKRILSLVRDVLSNRHEPSPSSTSSTESAEDTTTAETTNWDAPSINFEEFCVISSYLSVLQTEIEDNCCVSPIKGTNLPPPPIFLTNAPGESMFSQTCRLFYPLACSIHGFFK